MEKQRFASAPSRISRLSNLPGASLHGSSHGRVIIPAQVSEAFYFPRPAAPFRPPEAGVIRASDGKKNAFAANPLRSQCNSVSAQPYGAEGFDFDLVRQPAA
jgi:hypothetical protein